MLLTNFLLVLLSLLAHSQHFSYELSYSTNFKSQTTSFINNFISKFSPNCELIIAFEYVDNSTITDNVLEPLYFAQKLGETQQHAGVYLLNYRSATARSAFSSSPRFKDVHKIATDGSCSVNMILLSDLIIGVDDENLFNLLTPRYGPITRKDEDFFFFITQQKATAEAVLVSSNAFGNKIKFKVAFYPSPKFTVFTANMYGHKGEPLLTLLNLPPDILQVKETTEIETDKLTKVFPDFTRNLNGRALKMSVANVPFRFEIERGSDGRFHPKRGFHLLWLIEAMRKFNFTYDIFISSLGGGTGKQFENGTWGGSVGDILYGKADIAYQVAHIYNRHKFVEWASPFTYEAIIFIAHKPRTYFSANAIFWPFTPSTWALFFITMVASIICYKFLATSYIKIKYGANAENSWSNLRVLEYIIATFLEQDRGGPSSMPFHPIRIFCSAWLIFALVTATAYRAKLTPLMAFPLATFVPATYEELVDSDFGVGLNVVGKGDAAYTIFSMGRGKVYEGIFGKMGIYPDAVECVLKAVNEDFCCLIWDGYAEYIDAKNVTDKFGKSPLQMSQTKTSFIEDGLVFEKRSIFRKHFDITIRNAVNMGLTKKWLEMDLGSVKQTRTKWERSVNKTTMEYTVDQGPVKLKVAHFIGSIIIWASGLIVAFLSLVVEYSNKFLRSISFFKLKFRQ